MEGCQIVVIENKKIASFFVGSALLAAHSYGHHLDFVYLFFISPPIIIGALQGTLMELPVFLFDLCRVFDLMGQGNDVYFIEILLII